jgi:hypothetical protein
VHDGKFAEHFNLGRKGLVSTGGGCPYTLKSQDTQTFMIPPFGSRLNAFLVLDSISQKSGFMNIPKESLAHPSCNGGHRHPHYSLDLEMIVQKLHMGYKYTRGGQ